MVKKTVIEQLQQLQSVSEGAIEKLTQNQAARSALQSAAQLRERGDRILRGLDSVEAAAPLPVELDGEVAGTTPVRFEVLPGALRLRGPA